VVPESNLERTERGLVAKGGGCFVLNMRDAVWRHVDGRGAVCVVADDFEGERPGWIGFTGAPLPRREPTAYRDGWRPE
jgi:hypothetical protein